jgi:hypothetical protein
MDRDWRSSQRWSACRGVGLNQDLPSLAGKLLYLRRSSYLMSIDHVAWVNSHQIPHHVKSFEAQFHGNPRGETIVDSRTYDQIFRVS